MKKVILTEVQLQMVLDHALNEQRTQIYKLPELAEIISRLDTEESDNYDADIVLKILQSVYRSHGDEGVMYFFNLGTKLNLEPMGYGRYVIK